MQLIKNLALLALAGTGFGFVVDLYAEEDCVGEPIENVNVWDNTCSSDHTAFSSMKPRAFGGSHQKGAAYFDTGCNALMGSWMDWWVDGGDDGFQIDKCINPGFTSRALGSRSA